MEILLVRHGLPVRIENDDGRRADPPLGDPGHRQAQAVADWLESERIDAIYTSPLRRAIQTAEPLAATTGLDAKVEPGVTEIDHDATSYVPLEEIKAADPARWRELVQGGLYEGNDVGVFQRVVVDSIDRIIRAHAGQKVAVFCHGGVVNAWTCHVLGIPMALIFDVYYTSVSRFMAAGSGERSVASLNEIGHLRGTEL